jgi:MFS family permease
LQAVNITAYLAGPAGSLWFVCFGALAGAIGFGVYNPVLNGYWSNLMTDRERPRILAFTTVASMLVTMPAPTIAGALFTIHPRGPMFMQLGVFLLICSCFLMAARARQPRRTR